MRVYEYNDEPLPPAQRCAICGQDVPDDFERCYDCRLSNDDSVMTKACSVGDHSHCPDVSANCCECSCHCS